MNSKEIFLADMAFMEKTKHLREEPKPIKFTKIDKRTAKCTSESWDNRIKE